MRVLALCALFASAAHATTLGGRVVDSQEQRAFADAQVQVGGRTSATTDASGFFRVSDLPGGPALVQVQLPDGRRFNARAVLPAQGSFYLELDRSRHAPPEEDDEY